MMKLPDFMMSVMSDCAIWVSARATRSAVVLAIWVTRRSTMIAWLSSTAPMVAQLGDEMVPKPALLWTMTTALVLQSVNKKALSQKAFFNAICRSAFVTALE